MYRITGRLALWWLDHAPARLRPPLVGVLGYIGPASGRRIRLVVLPLPVDGKWVVAVGNHRRKRWWKAFRHPLIAEFNVAGTVSQVEGVLVTGRQRDHWLAAYDARFPRARPKHGPDTPVVLFSRRGVESGS